MAANDGTWGGEHRAPADSGQDLGMGRGARPGSLPPCAAADLPRSHAQGAGAATHLPGLLRLRKLRHLPPTTEPLCWATPLGELGRCPSHLILTMMRIGGPGSLSNSSVATKLNGRSWDLNPLPHTAGNLRRALWRGPGPALPSPPRGPPPSVCVCMASLTWQSRCRLARVSEGPGGLFKQVCLSRKIKQTGTLQGHCGDHPRDYA